jgi:hypothetical protein
MVSGTQPGPTTRFVLFSNSRFFDAGSQYIMIEASKMTEGGSVLFWLNHNCSRIASLSLSLSLSRDASYGNAYKKEM